jgi:hypothetical protein
VLPSVNLADLADLADVAGVSEPDELGSPRPPGGRYWDVDRCRWVRRQPHD